MTNEQNVHQNVQQDMPMNRRHDTPANNDHDRRREHVECPSEVCSNINLAVPVEIRTHTDVGNIVLECRGYRIVGDHSRPRKVSRFEIIQEVFAKIPIEFITEVEVERERVDIDVHPCTQC